MNAIAGSVDDDPTGRIRAHRPTRAPFGIKAADVAKFLISMALAIVVAYYGMQFAIERNTAAIDENKDQITEVGAKVDEHRGAAHRELDGRIRKVERTTDRIEVMQGQTLEAIREIKTDLKEARREHRRRR